MSAELLRRAAALMREQAETATPGPWHMDGPWWIDTGEYDMVTGLDRKAVAVPAEPTANPSDMQHIASWDPAVALAVADWLDGLAQREEANHAVPGRSAALAVARAYLGEA